MATRVLIIRVSFILWLILAAACVPVEFLSDVPEELEAVSAGIVPGQSTRAELQANLGEPFATSVDETVEVFRAATGHDVTGVVWLGPAPPLFGGRDVNWLPDGSLRRGRCRSGG